MADTNVSILNNTPPDSFFATLDGVIVNVINGNLGNANTSYSYVDLVKSGFNMFAIQFVIQATTLTIEGTNDLPSVSDASANWSDLTLVLTSGSASSFTATGSLSLILPLPWSRLRFKRLTTNATNAIKLILTRTTLK